MCKREIASVVRYSTSLAGCNCPDWKYRPHRHPCKHVTELADACSVVREWEDKNGRPLMPEWTVEIKD